MLSRTIHVSGTVVGRLWWPVGEPASLVVSGEIVHGDQTVFPTGGPFPDQRTALVELANPGDLASARFLRGSLLLEVRTTRCLAAAPPRDPVPLLEGTRTLLGHGRHVRR